MVNSNVTLIGKNFSDNVSVYINTSEFSEVLSNVNGIYLTKAGGGTVEISATKANPCVITATAHGFTDMQIATFTGTSPFNEWNQLFSTPRIIRYLDANSFSLYDYNCVQLECYNLFPKLLDESLEMKYWAGGYKKIKNARIEFLIKFVPWKTEEWQEDRGGSLYWQLMNVIYKHYFYISDVGSAFTQLLASQNLNLMYPNSFTLPLEVELFELGDLTPNNDEGNESLEIKVVTKEWFLFN